MLRTTVLNSHQPRGIANTGSLDTNLVPGRRILKFAAALTALVATVLCLIVLANPSAYGSWYGRGHEPDSDLPLSQICGHT